MKTQPLAKSSKTDQIVKLQGLTLILALFFVFFFFSSTHPRPGPRLEGGISSCVASPDISTNQ